MTYARIIHVNGTNLYVQDTGEANLPVVLCLHSLFLDGRMFDGFVEAARGRFRVVRPDFRGQGRSDLDPVDLIHMDTLVGDMMELIDTLELKRINLLVQSMGGDVAFRLVAKQPQLFRRMAVLGSSARSEPADQLHRFREWTNNVGKHGFIGETLDETMAIMFGETTRNDPNKRDLIELWRDRIAAVPRRLRPAMAGVIERESVLHLLPALTLPVLVISGDEDLPRPPEWAEEVAEALPNADLIRLEKVGHSPILEAPEIVLPKLIEFFGD
ncbi:alpha/beta fold hydrolase [Micromonospora fulviviridis]|uniref:Alpha/beta hydrolase n=1 Tax=Micromonospora fulviviridis TaxID=47860 RepID=A0ABV2VTV2_9ACTN